MEIKVLWLYHDLMDLYGDRGNIQTLKLRCKKRNIKFHLETCGLNEIKNFSEFDLIFMGGGADKEQRLLSQDLNTKKVGLQKALENNSFFLLICGGYQLFGAYYEDANFNKIEGLHFLSHYTVAPKNKKRCVGNIIIDSNLDDELIRICGFENHGGQTYGVEKPFGTVVKGHGNQYQSEFEGVYTGQILGTYLHGPLLPKNAKLADFIIKKSLKRKYGDIILEKLDDNLENSALDTMVNRVLRG